ncbi:hypothetical protein [Halomonas sp. DQ26W]|uniref:hypothetical protein n=1 Tax=Halomonas sp. DQ26W TaxID=2282311 RepID=UPI0015F08CAA|nr:hypothetical protein [Halomonas sp. DQ26W]
MPHYGVASQPPRQQAWELLFSNMRRCCLGFMQALLESQLGDLIDDFEQHFVVLI